jgi:hypothetical protein
MKSRFANLLSERSDRVRFALFVLAAGVAFIAGFVLFTPPTLERVIIRSGYYFIFSVFSPRLDSMRGGSRVGGGKSGKLGYDDPAGWDSGCWWRPAS